jgi:hypothetical protein
MIEPLTNAASAIDMSFGDEIDAPAQQGFADVTERIGAKSESNGLGQFAQAYRSGHGAGQPSTPARYDPEVRSAVDSEISVHATPALREQAYLLAQSYVNQVGGIGDAGITAEALPAQTLALLKQAGIPTVADDARVDAARILEVGSRFGTDDYPARLDAYAQALAQGSADYDKALLAEILAKDPQAFGSWLQPGEINAAVASGKITQSERAAIAQAFVGAYNDRAIPSYENVETGVAVYGFNPVGGYYANPVEEARATSEFLKFIDAAGSTPETREFRQSFAQYLTDSYALNDKLPVYETYGHAIQNHAAAVAALLVSGDQNNPQLAQSFLTSLGDKKLDAFLQRVEAGSVALTAGYLGPQLEMSDPLGKVADIAQPDALSKLVTTVGNAEGAGADRLAVTLARVPGDHDAWFTDNSERADAWTHLFNGHSNAILQELTNPDGLPVSDEGKIEPAFKDRAHDLGAYLRLINGSNDVTKIEQARSLITDYGITLRDNIEGATTAEDGIDNGRRLGFLGAAVTESVSQAFREHAETQEQKKALVAFALDLAVAAIPAGDLAKGALGNFFKSNISSSAIQTSLTGFSGKLIDSASGKLTDAAKEHILTHLDDGDLDSLVAKLRESNEFVEDSLLADLPAPAYEPGEAGRADTIQTVNDAYDIALVWLNPPK